MIIISDIHGCFLTLQALLKKVPDEEIIFLGDLIDRGPRSKEVVQFTMDQKIPCTQGNHDHMAWGSYEGAIVQGQRIEDVWIMNGADATYKSYGSQIPDNHLAFLKSLPFYFEFPGLLLSHTGNGRDGQDIYGKIWNRAISPKSDEYLIFGHSRVSHPIIEPNYANIDTGCAYKSFGTLTAIQWPSLKIWQQKYCD